MPKRTIRPRKSRHSLRKLRGRQSTPRPIKTSKRLTNRRRVAPNKNGPKAKFPAAVPRNLQSVKFNAFIKKVLKRVKPHYSMDRESAAIVDDLMKKTLHHIANQASSKMGRRKTLKPKMLLRGMKKVMPRQMLQRYDKRARQALDRYGREKKRRRSGQHSYLF